MKKLLIALFVTTTFLTSAHADPRCLPIAEFAGTVLDARFSGVSKDRLLESMTAKDDDILRMIVDEAYELPMLHTRRTQIRAQVQFEARHEALCVRALRGY